MSRELEQARALVAQGKTKKALKPLWVVESRARTNIDEARGLLELASIVENLESKGAQRDAHNLAGLAEGYLNRLEADPATGAVAVMPSRVLGASGLAVRPGENWTLIFKDEALLLHGTELLTIPYGEITQLEVGEPPKDGSLGRTVATGAAKVLVHGWVGAAFANDGHNTMVTVQTAGGEGFFLDRSDRRPGEWRIALSAVFTRLRQPA